MNNDNQLSFYLLTKDIYESNKGGIVGPEKATLRIELDMSRLVKGTNGGRRRSSRKIVRKMRKRNSRAKTRNYRTRK